LQTKGSIGNMSTFTGNIFALLDDDAPAPVKKETKKKEEKPKKEARKEKPQRESNKGERPPRNDNRQNRPRGGGRGGGRGGAGRGGAGREKREFDRHSGTGRDDRQKRNGSGRFNWGSEGEDNRPRRAPRDNKKDAAPTEEPAADAAAPVEGEAPKEAEPVEEGEPVEVEPETVSYEDYLKQKADNALAEDAVSHREVNNDDFQGQTATSFVRVDEEAEGPDYVIGTATKAKKGRKQKEKKQLNIDEFKAQGKSAGRGRGAGGRGGRGRGGDRNGAGARRGGNKINTSDVSQFPALG